MKERILPAEGKPGILVPGLGMVATTFIAAGVEAVKKELAQPKGSFTHLGLNHYQKLVDTYDKSA